MPLLTSAKSRVLGLMDMTGEFGIKILDDPGIWLKKSLVKPGNKITTTVKTGWIFMRNSSYGCTVVVASYHLRSLHNCCPYHHLLHSLDSAVAPPRSEKLFMSWPPNSWRRGALQALVGGLEHLDYFSIYWE